MGDECRNAIAATRAGLYGPAHPHASNIIDSIGLCLHGGQDGCNHVKQSAQEDFNDQPLHLAAENLTLRPLFRAFTPGFPISGANPPDYFARHATSHAVGHAGSVRTQLRPRRCDAGHIAHRSVRSRGAKHRR